MVKKRVIIILLFLLLFSGVMSFAQTPPPKTYTWNQFQFTYPQHWSLVEDQEVEHTRQVRLIVEQQEGIQILLSLMDPFPGPDEQYKKLPVMASVSYGLGLALKLAGQSGDSAIALSYGSIELADGPHSSARFTIAQPDTREFHTLECFHYIAADMAYFGIILSKGLKGQVVENLMYHQYVADAYAIIRSLVIK